MKMDLTKREQIAAIAMQGLLSNGLTLAQLWDESLSEVKHPPSKNERIRWVNAMIAERSLNLADCLIASLDLQASERRLA